MSFKGTPSQDLLNKNYTVKIIASDGFKSISAQFVISFKYKELTIDTSKPTVAEQFKKAFPVAVHPLRPF